MSQILLAAATLVLALQGCAAQQGGNATAPTTYSRFALRSSNLTVVPALVEDEPVPVPPTPSPKPAPSPKPSPKAGPKPSPKASPKPSPKAGGRSLKAAAVLGAKDEAAVEGILFSLGKAGGLEEKYEYAQAYMNPDTYELENGTNWLGSFQALEANNTYVLVANETVTYTSLEAILSENNTLALEGSIVQLGNSSLRLDEHNWFKVVDGSFLLLNNSRINGTDFFTWYLSGSTVASNFSIIETRDMLTWLDNSTWVLTNTSLITTSDSKPEPEGYEGKLPIALAATASSLIDLDSTSWEVEDMHVLFNASALALTNSTIQLYNSTLNLYDSLLLLNNSEILLYNSTLGLYGTSQTLGEIDAIKVYDAAQVTGPLLLPDTPASDVQNATQALLQKLVGSPLGTLPFELVDADADVLVEDV